MAIVVFAPLAYPGYDWKSQAVSDLSAAIAPSLTLANQLNALFGPEGIFYFAIDPENPPGNEKIENDIKSIISH